MDEFFIPENKLDLDKVHISPSGNYKLTIEIYSTTAKCWSYSRGIVHNLSNEIVCDIKRNYSSFPFSFVTKDGQEWIACGKSYTGQTIINLDTGYEYDNPGEHNSFCWSDIKSDSNGSLLMVVGCHWGSSYEVRFYKFEEPYTQIPIEVSLQLPGGHNMANYLLCDFGDCKFTDDGKIHYTLDYEYAEKFNKYDIELNDEEMKDYYEGDIETEFRTVIDVILEYKDDKIVLFKNNLI